MIDRVRVKRGWVLLLGVGATACGGTAPSPSSWLDGEWGGFGTEVNASLLRITFDIPCANGTIRAPVIPDASGRFTTDASMVTYDSTRTIMVSGQSSADTLRLTFTNSAGNGQADTLNTITAVRGVPPTPA
ncbi:MAG: hypothetical protein ACHQXA_08690, partial [Gemmatimonadales bacterium]